MTTQCQISIMCLKFSACNLALTQNWQRKYKHTEYVQTYIKDKVTRALRRQVTHQYQSLSKWFPDGVTIATGDLSILYEINI